MTKSLVIFSGGQDSTTCLYWAIKNYGAENVYAIAFDYGQRHKNELKSAKHIARISKIAGFEIVKVPNILKSHSPLTDQNVELEQYKNFEEMEEIIGNRVEVTVVPMRNALFLTIAANRAVELGATSIVTGVCGGDNNNFPDCTQAFIDSQEQTINMSLGIDGPEQIKIETPLMNLTKAETVKLARKLKGCWRALSWTTTSYDGKYPPVDNNHSNVLRAKGFEEAGYPDPLVVRAYRAGLMELPATSNYDSLRGK